MDGPFVDAGLPARGGTSRPRCRAHLVPSDGAGVTGAGGRTPHRGRTMSWPGASRINRFSRLACYSSGSPSRAHPLPRRAITGFPFSCNFHIDTQRTPPCRFLDTESRPVPSQPIGRVQAHPPPAIGRCAQLAATVDCDRGREPVPLCQCGLEWVEPEPLPFLDLRGVDAECFPVLEGRGRARHGRTFSLLAGVPACPSNSDSPGRDHSGDAAGFGWAPHLTTLPSGGHL